MYNADSASSDESDVNTDALFDLLSDTRRRYVLSYLHGTDGDVAELSELVDWVMRQEADGGDDDRYESVAVALHHTHLPRLAESGVLDYDVQSQTVHYRGQSAVERMEALVEGIEDDRR